jgi:hypothetical protein
MLILVMRIAQAQAFLFHLTVSSASQRHQSGITTYPLLTPRRFAQRRLGITTQPAMRTSNRLGFHAIGRHELPLCGSGESRSALRSAERCIGSRIILCSWLIGRPPCIALPGLEPLELPLRDAS